MQPDFPADPQRAEDFRINLLRWYKKNHRSLPWRATGDPYAIWISETMLQQTQVATVIPYFQRWLTLFPTVRDLAEAPLDDVLQAWQGLGYYSRARNLHKAAQQIVANHDGVFPGNYDDVLALPGVGRYTAGAVCSIALGLDTPIVDANVVRVLCRVFGIHGDPKGGEAQAALWRLATELIPSGDAGTFNQAMMELGALVCATPPKCDGCPVRSECYAFDTGAPSALPEFAPKPDFTTQTDVSAIVMDGDEKLLLIRRPLDAGLWAGLWELPRVTAEAEETPGAAACRAIREAVGIEDAKAVEITPLGKVRHGVTTRKITLLGIAVSIGGMVTPSDKAAWATTQEALDGYALASPQRRLIEQIAERRRAAVVQPTLF
ncbi:MAG: A/G-specific adenine glycosylase [Akkermansiaceae bacterium]|nr:A/G-specific adenine glycosylase [Armatimonadota bacterium]